MRRSLKPTQAYPSATGILPVGLRGMGDSPMFWQKSPKRHLGHFSFSGGLRG